MRAALEALAATLAPRWKPPSWYVTSWRRPAAGARAGRADLARGRGQRLREPPLAGLGLGLQPGLSGVLQPAGKPAGRVPPPPALPRRLLRLAYIGVPSSTGRTSTATSRQQARVVYNEIQRQFAMPNPGDSLAEQYTGYTYPTPSTSALPTSRPSWSKGGWRASSTTCRPSATGASATLSSAMHQAAMLTLEGNSDFWAYPACEDAGGGLPGHAGAAQGGGGGRVSNVTNL